MIEDYREIVKDLSFAKEFDEYCEYIKNFPGLNISEFNLGYHRDNILLSQLIPKDKIVVDVGCGFGFQHILYKDHVKWIGIQHFWPQNIADGKPEIKIFTGNGKIFIGKLKDVWQELGITNTNKNKLFGIASRSLWLDDMPESEEEDRKIFLELFPKNHYITGN